MFVCYLDDSGKDPYNDIETLAGYITTKRKWEIFEKDVKPVFKEFEVDILHAKKLNDRDGKYRTWDWNKRKRFVSRLCTTFQPHDVFGLSFSVLKETYRARKAESLAEGVGKVSHYAFCFCVIVDALLKPPLIDFGPVSFIVEDGHKSNPEVRDLFERMKKGHQFGSQLGTISFPTKESSRAIQMADLFAYYSRRHQNGIVASQGKGASPHQPEPILDIINDHLDSYTRVVTNVSDGTL